MWPSCGLNLASSDVKENDDDDKDDDDDDDEDRDDDYDDDDDNNNNNKLNLTTSTCPHEDLLYDIGKSLVRMQHDDRQTHELTPHVQKFIDTTYGRLTMAFASAAMYSKLLLAAPLIH